MVCEKCHKNSEESYKFYQLEYVHTSSKQISYNTRETTETYKSTGRVFEHYICNNCIERIIFIKSLFTIPLIILSIMLTKNYILNPNPNISKDNLWKLFVIFINSLPLIIAIHINLRLRNYWKIALSLCLKFNNSMVSAVSKKHYKYVDEFEYNKLKPYKEGELWL